MDTLIILYTQSWVSLCSLAADHKSVNFTFRHTILCDAVADHYLGLLKVNFLTFAPKSLLPFSVFIYSVLIVSLIKTKLSAYSSSLAHPLWQIQSQCLLQLHEGRVTAQILDASTNSSFSNNSESTLTLVFVPSYRLITDLTKASGIPFFLTAHSYTFLATLSLDQYSENWCVMFLQIESYFTDYLH